MDGETSSMDESAILGSHPWMEKCHPRMEKCHPWMSSMDGNVSFMDGEMSSIDGSVICRCHPWMTLPSVDEDDGWQTWTEQKYDGHTHRQVQTYACIQDR